MQYWIGGWYSKLTFWRLDKATSQAPESQDACLQIENRVAAIKITKEYITQVRSLELY